jgi:hypothetical protein
VDVEGVHTVWILTLDDKFATPQDLQTTPVRVNNLSWIEIATALQWWNLGTENDLTNANYILYRTCI